MNILSFLVALPFSCFFINCSTATLKFVSMSTSLTSGFHASCVCRPNFLVKWSGSCAVIFGASPLFFMVILISFFYIFPASSKSAFSSCAVSAFFIFRLLLPSFSFYFRALQDFLSSSVPEFSLSSIVQVVIAQVCLLSGSRMRCTFLGFCSVFSHCFKMTFQISVRAVSSSWAVGHFSFLPLVVEFPSMHRFRA